MHALSSSMSTNTPARPRSPTTFVANRTSGSVMEASGSRWTSTKRRRVATTLPPDAHPLRPVRVWVDLTNSPHVLVLRPVIEGLRARGADVEVTARDFAQTVGLAERFGLRVDVIGRHRGGRVAAKALGLASRATALVRWARGRRFDLALGHRSNDATLAAAGPPVPPATAFPYQVAAHPPP